MKRLAFLLLICATSMLMDAQNYTIERGVIALTSATSVIKYIPMKTSNPGLIEFNYLDFDDVDAVLDLANVVAADGTLFNRIINDSIPYIMADSSITFTFDNFPAPYLGAKVTRNSVSAGKVVIWLLVIKR